ncbi:hypothetical protein NLG97_g676 [Lecanicillium saksenae]|uniref:Uncharacterized protein n=1 Tax=Lecanicillium saksenae TaxID=468837 RepID=A0ACC1R5V4_9HYPO|nr:hypothetical protein NLG97_g676 [Lecanicillium saksenae]
MMSSREDSMTSSVFGDSESVITDDIPVVISRKATGDWEEGGLGIAEADILNSGTEGSPKNVPHLLTQHSAPSQMEQAVRSLDKFRAKRESSERRSSEGTDSADDEDEEAGHAKDKHHARRGSKALSGKTPLPSSKLGIEMMRANSHDSVTMGSESTPETVTQVATTPSHEVPPDLGQAGEQGTSTTPPTTTDEVDATPRPSSSAANVLHAEDEPTPRPAGK